MVAMTFRTFSAYPGVGPIQEAWLLLNVLYLVFWYPWFRPRSCHKLLPFERYMVGLVVIAPPWAGLCAWNEFGQSIPYGMLAVRPIVLAGGVLFIVRALRRGVLTLHDLETALLMLAWGTMILYTFIRLTLNPASFSQYAGFVTLGTDPIFYLPNQLVIFGTFYYALRGIRNRHVKDYFLALLMFSGAIDRIIERQMMVAVFISFLLFVFRWNKPKRLLLLIPKLSIGFALLIGLLYATMPDAMAERFAKFEDAFTVFSGREVEDSSAQMHYLEVLYAIPQIAKHPMMGNGRLSNQWLGGSEEVRGQHFYPEDVGILGVMYQYGVVGLIVFGWQYWFGFQATRTLGRHATSPLLDGTKGFVLYSAVLSVGASMCVFDAPVTLFFIAVLVVIANQAMSANSVNQQNSFAQLE